jgi:hypothetical protein
MDSSDWSNGIRYQIFGTGPWTEFKATQDVASIIFQALIAGLHSRPTNRPATRSTRGIRVWRRRQRGTEVQVDSINTCL